MVFEKVNLKKKKSTDNKKSMQNYPACKEFMSVLTVSEILIAPHLNATLIPPHARTSSSDAQSGTSGQQAETSTTGNPGGDVGTSQGATSGGNA